MANELSLDAEQLAIIVQGAVGQAVSDALATEREVIIKSEDSARALAAANSVGREVYDARLKRVKLWAGATVTVVTCLTSGFAMIYAKGQAAQAQAQHEVSQDRMISSTQSELVEHELSSAAAHTTQNTKLKNLGALQIEQGSDQRRILLESAPRKVREDYDKKSPELLEAEGRVLRD